MRQRLRGEGRNGGLPFGPLFSELMIGGAAKAWSLSIFCDYGMTDHEMSFEHSSVFTINIENF